MVGRFADFDLGPDTVDPHAMGGVFEHRIAKFAEVATIKGEGSSKTTELSDALAVGKKIVLCTLQTFPFAVARIHELAATEGKRFAVIADEAHSSQSDAIATELKLALPPEEQVDAADGGEVSVEDHLAAEMQARLWDCGT